MKEKKIICMRCGRPFPVWDVHKKNVECPFCDAKGKNPYYVKPKRIKPENMFRKFESG